MPDFNTHTEKGKKLAFKVRAENMFTKAQPDSL